jgi:hypothetical protein
MSVGMSLMWIVIDFTCLVIWTGIVGATAPRWPDRWLQSDPFPLRQYRWETVALYRKLGTPWFAKHLPEFGSTFGGESKRTLPGTSVADLRAYLIEVRRAEWVHWMSMISWGAYLMTVVAIALNTPFMLILRFNHLRLLAALKRAQSIGIGPATST